jgi:hypothetical protein
LNGVGAADFAIALVLVGLHFSGVVAARIDANGGGHAVEDRLLDQVFESIEAFELGERDQEITPLLRCKVQVLLLRDQPTGNGGLGSKEESDVSVS